MRKRAQNKSNNIDVTSPTPNRKVFKEGGREGETQNRRMSNYLSYSPSDTVVINYTDFTGAILATWMLDLAKFGTVWHLATI